MRREVGRVRVSGHQELSGSVRVVPADGQRRAFAWLTVENVPLIDHPPPSAVGLAASDFSSHAAIEKASRAQRQVTDSKGRPLIPECQLHPRGDEVLEHLTDCLAPNRHPPGLDGHRSVRLVERYQAVDVACIHAFHIEALKVLGLNCGYVRHRARLPAA